MSTILNSFSRPSTRVAATGTSKASPSRAGVRGLSFMLLAAAVSTVVLLAEQLGSALTDGDLFMGWVLMWVVVFASLALLAGSTRALAGRVMAALDGWSRSVARSRADARTWSIAQTDPRLMADLMHVLQRDDGADFEAALAPLGLEAVSTETPPTVSAWERFSERLIASRANSPYLHYI